MMPPVMPPMTLRDRLDEYVSMRRALGFQLNDLERQVGLFCAWLAARGQTQTFTVDEAVTWARLNPDALLADSFLDRVGVAVLDRRLR